MIRHSRRTQRSSGGRVTWNTVALDPQAIPQRCQQGQSASRIWRPTPEVSVDPVCNRNSFQIRKSRVTATTSVICVVNWQSPRLRFQVWPTIRPPPAARLRRSRIHRSTTANTPILHSEIRNVSRRCPRHRRRPCQLHSEASPAAMLISSSHMVRARSAWACQSRRMAAVAVAVEILDGEALKGSSKDHQQQLSRKSSESLVSTTML